MKTKQKYTVPLTADMLDLLDSMPRHAGSELVFHSKSGKQLSDMTLSATMKRMHKAELGAGHDGFLDRDSGRPAVPHGLRSTFRDWAAEHGYDHNLAETQLAHRIGTSVTQAYLRSDVLEQRREMMEAWGRFLQQTYTFG